MNRNCSSSQFGSSIVLIFAYSLLASVIISSNRSADATWPSLAVDYQGKQYPVVHLTTGGGGVKSITAEDLRINIVLQSERDGQVQLAIPKELLDATRISYDSKGFVPGIFVDAIKTEDYKAEPRAEDIIFTIPFEGGTKRIEIVGSPLPYSDQESSQWKTANIIGKFLNSDPPKPDQIFKVQYRVINGTIEKFNAQYGFEAEVNSSAGRKGTLEVKFPRNYPYTNEVQETHGGNAFLFINKQPFEDTRPAQITDCFFVFSIPFTGNTEIGLAWTYLLWTEPYHGDKVPDNCIPQTLVGAAPSSEQLRLCSEFDIALESCNDKEIIRKRTIVEDEKRIDEQQNQINNSMYIIGVGAAIAGLFAFIALRRFK